MTRFTVYFSGHVQGVGFRYTTRNVALNHRVAGYVRNLDDGRVEVVAEGEEAELKAFVEAVCESMSGYVKSHTIDRGAASGEFGPATRGALSIRH